MSIKFTAVKCPECGANLKIEEGREKLFCRYCGTEILVTNENEQVVRHVDEASVKHAETARMVEIKKMEIAEKKRESEERHKEMKVKISLAIGGVMLFFFFLSIWFHKLVILGVVCAAALILMWKNKKGIEILDMDYKIPVPAAINGYENQKYTVVEAVLRSAGFDNITCIPLNDLRMGVLKKPFIVETVIIDGNVINHGGRKFKPDSPVVITYHTIYDETKEEYQ